MIESSQKLAACPYKHRQSHSALPLDKNTELNCAEQAAQKAHLRMGGPGAVLAAGGPLVRQELVTRIHSRAVAGRPPLRHARGRPSRRRCEAVGHGLRPAHAVRRDALVAAPHAPVDVLCPHIDAAIRAQLLARGAAGAALLPVPAAIGVPVALHLLCQ